MQVGSQAAGLLACHAQIRGQSAMTQGTENIPSKDPNAKEVPNGADKNTPKADTHSSMLADVWNLTKDFGEGVYHGGIENPYNGAAQLSNHLLGTELPELHLVDADHLSNTLGGQIGNLVGTAADIYAVSLATAGVGGLVSGALAAEGTAAVATTEAAAVGAEAVSAAAATGAEATALTAAGSTSSALVGNMVAGGLKLGAIGAAYTGLFQPTDPNSKSFYKDRLENSAVAFATMGAMGAAGGALDATGLFAVPSVRSLVGNLSYGGLTGTAAGLVHSEADAIKNGNILPSLKSVGSDIASYAAFGMAYGAINYGFNKYISPPETRTFNSDKANFSVQVDKSGNPISIKANVPALGEDQYRVGFNSTLSTTGQWDSTAWTTDNQGRPVTFYPARPPQLDNVSIDGKTLVLNSEASDGVVREAEDGGAYTRRMPKVEERQAEERALYLKHNPTTVEGDKTITRNYDENMNLQRMQSADTANPDDSSAVSIYRSENNQISSVGLSTGTKPELSISKQADGSWKVYRGDQIYKWNGDVNVTQSSDGQPEQVTFNSSNGDSAVFTGQGGADSAVRMIEQTSSYMPGATGRPVIKVDAAGNATITAGPRLSPTVNGVELKPGETAPLMPGDDVRMTIDVGDRYPVWETRRILWSQSPDGKPVFGAQPLTPGAAVDYSVTDTGTKIVPKTQALAAEVDPEAGASS
jgi:hypothetical protein